MMNWYSFASDQTVVLVRRVPSLLKKHFWQRVSFAILPIIGVDGREIDGELYLPSLSLGNSAYLHHKENGGARAKSGNSATHRTDYYTTELKGARRKYHHRLTLPMLSW